MRSFAGTLMLLLFLSASAFGYIDPFINPIKTMKVRKKVNFAKLKPKIFKNVKFYDLDKYSIEGVIGKGNEIKLVLKDPETGKIHLLPEGTPIDVNLVLQKVSRNSVIIKEYYYTKAGKIRSRLRSIKINAEE